MKRTILIISTLVLITFSSAYSNESFKAVHIKTPTLTMTGMRADPTPNDSLNIPFEDVHITTPALTMTGMRDD